jgi:hypothetical protein
MLAVDLFTRDDGFVVTVKVPPFHPPAEAIAWGSRFFIRGKDGIYREGLVWLASEGMTT